MVKKKKRGKMKKVFSILLTSGILALIFGMGFVLSESHFNNIGNVPNAGVWREKELRIHFLDVGQGDCILIELPDGKKMMIDGGNGSSEHNRRILSYLRALGIDKLDYLLLTHADEDHCGGLERVLEETRVSRAYLPHEATLDSDSTYLSLYRKVLKEVPAVEYSERYDYIRGENYFMLFLLPHSVALSDGADENESSAVVWLDYLGVSALFTGDMTAENEESLLKEYAWDIEEKAIFEENGLPYESIFELNGMKAELDSTEILKVAHHGSAYSSSLEWLQLLNFQTAVISCGAGNSYGHPSGAALASLRAANPAADIYRTDECGNVVVTVSDGDYFVTYQNQSEAVFAASRAEELLGLTYINIKLLHTENFAIC